MGRRCGENALGSCVGAAVAAALGLGTALPRKPPVLSVSLGPWVAVMGELVITGPAHSRALSACVSISIFHRSEETNRSHL